MRAAGQADSCHQGCRVVAQRSAGQAGTWRLTARRFLEVSSAWPCRRLTMSLGGPPAGTRSLAKALRLQTSDRLWTRLRCPAWLRRCCLVAAKPSVEACYRRNRRHILVQSYTSQPPASPSARPACAITSPLQKLSRHCHTRLLQRSQVMILPRYSARRPRAASAGLGFI